MALEALPKTIPSRYEVTALLGQGGMGNVYRALDRESGREVALKTLRVTSSEERRRFEREARTLGALRHEGVARLLDIGGGAGEIYFTMELVRGLPLSAFVGRPLPDGEVIGWLIRVAVRLLEALEYIHSQGVLHRDLKPSNVMVLLPDGEPAPALDPDGAMALVLRQPEPAVKLLDFGLADEREGVRRGRTLACGTPLYMSSEALAGSASLDERTDLYSLGALLYHLIAGQPPFATIAEAHSRRHRLPPPRELNRSCPEGLGGALLRLLEREPSRRPASAAEAREAFLAILGRAAPAGGPLRPRLLGPVFVGRATELESLRAHLRRAASGSGTCIQVAGERGIGKTWLLRSSGILGEAFVELGMRSICASCVRGAPHRGLLGLLAGLRDCIATSPEGGGPSRGDAEPVPDPLEPWISALLGAPGMEGAAGTPEAAVESAAAGNGERARAYPVVPRFTPDEIAAAATRVLRLAAAGGALVLVLEDLQYADDLEVEVLSRWLGVLAEFPLALIVSYRPEAIRAAAAAERWLKEAQAEGHPPAIVLGTLTDGELRQLAEHVLRPAGKVSERLLAALAGRSEGKPLSSCRWLQLFWEQGALRHREGIWELAGDETGALGRDENAALQRLATLAPAEGEVLRAAAVIGGPFEEDLLSEIGAGAGGAPSPAAGATAGAAGGASLRPLLRSLVSRGFLVEGVEGFALAPDLDGEAIAALSTPEELRAGHARAAAGLLRLFGLAGESRFFQIARHFQRAGDLDRAAEHYVGAARYAARMYANRKGIEAYSLALDTCCRAERRRDIASELGDLYVRVGEYSGALRCFRLARELHAQVSREAAGAPNGDAHGPTNGGTAAEAATELEVGFLERLGRILQRQGKLEEALAHFALCLERGGSFPSLRARALFRLGSLHLERGDLGAARAQLEESLTLYERLSDFEQIAEVHSHLGIVEKHEDRLEAASRRFEKAMESAERSGNLSKLATTLNNLGNLHRAIGDDGRAIECLARSVALRERIGDRLGLGICLNNTAQIHSHRGEYAAAWKSTEAALKIFEEIGDPKGIVIARANLGEMKRVAGEFQQARELLVEILRLANRWRMQRFHGLILCSFGLLETDYGNYAAALERFHECLRAVPTDKPSETRALALTGFAAASIRRGDFERAEDAIEEALAIAREIKLREKLGSLVSAQTRLHLERGDPERALDIARQALSRGEAGMERFGAALLHREMGRVYRELGPDWADHTEKHLGRALAEFERMGSPHNAAEAHAELALYWRLLGEEEQAARFFSAAEDGFRLTGARPRLEEVLATRGRS